MSAPDPVLAGDIGGTNSRLALFQGTRAVFERTVASRGAALEDLIGAFLAEAEAQTGARPSRACLGIAGPVDGEVSATTNLPWVVDARAVAARLRIGRIKLVNDFYAAALGVTMLDGEHLLPLGGGAREAQGPIAVLGAGTGLGQAFLFWSRSDGHYKVVSSEGGHADFAPRTPLETGLLAFLAAKYGRVSYERVLSGAGLTDIFGFLSEEPACRALILPETLTEMTTADPAAVVSRRGLDGSDPVCRMALTIFSSLLGAVAGNLALYFLATGGVFVAGGIAPRIAPYLGTVAFRESFENKGRLAKVVARIPAFVVTHPNVGLLGAAVEACRL